MVGRVPVTLRIVFIGASGFGLRCLEVVTRMPECEVVGVITAPREFRISYRPQGVTNVLHADFAAFAASCGLPCLTMTGKMTDPEVIGQAKQWRPDLFVVVGWYHMVPAALRAIAPAVGMHASLLPDYSGGAPLVWAMINGEARTGITLFEMRAGVDDGPVLGQAEELILESDTIATLYARIEERGIELIGAALPRLARGEAVPVPQDPTRRRVFPQRSPEDGLIDWTWPARRLYDFVRAQTRPYPGAFTHFRGEKLTLWRVALCSPLRNDGADAAADGGLLTWQLGADPSAAMVTCGDGQRVSLIEVGWGGAALSGEEFVRDVARGHGCAERLG